MGAYVEVRRFDGTSQRFPIEDAEVMLGRSANVQISLPSEAALDLEHVLLMPRGRRGCWVSPAESVINPLMLEGKPFSARTVPWGTEFTVDSLTIKIEREESRRIDLSKIDPKILIAAALVLLFFGWSHLRISKSDIQPANERRAPALFAEGSGCPSPENALQAAERAERIADSRADRYPYDPEDGVQAALQYGEAEACYRDAGFEIDARRMAIQNRQLREVVESQYALARTKFFRAIERQQWKTALVESRRLEALTAHIDRNDPFVFWLHEVKRRIAAKVSHGQ